VAAQAGLNLYPLCGFPADATAEMSYIGIGDVGIEFHLDAQHLAVSAFDDEVDLVIAVARAQVTYPGLGSLCGRAHRQGRQ
jgi:hypothetical protein